MVIEWGVVKRILLVLRVVFVKKLKFEFVNSNNVRLLLVLLFVKIFLLKLRFFSSNWDWVLKGIKWLLKYIVLVINWLLWLKVLKLLIIGVLVGIIILLDLLVMVFWRSKIFCILIFCGSLSLLVG